MRKLFLLPIVLFASCVEHPHNFQCIDGHTEVLPMYDVNLKMVVPTSVYTCDKWACDSQYCNKGAHQL